MPSRARGSSRFPIHFEEPPLQHSIAYPSKRSCSLRGPRDRAVAQCARAIRHLKSQEDMVLQATRVVCLGVAGLLFLVEPVLQFHADDILAPMRSGEHLRITNVGDID